MSRFRALLLSSKFWLRFYAGQAVLWIIIFPFGMTIWNQSIILLQFISLTTALTAALGGMATTLAEMKANPKIPLSDPSEDDQK